MKLSNYILNSFDQVHHVTVLSLSFSTQIPEGEKPSTDTSGTSSKNNLLFLPQWDKARRTPPASLCNHWPTFSTKWATEQDCLESDLLVSSHFNSGVLQGLPWQPCEVHINRGPGAAWSKSANLMKLHCVHHAVLLSNKQLINAHIHQLLNSLKGGK